MPLRMKIRGKMIALIAVPTAVIYVVVLGLTMAHLRGENRAEIEQELTRLAVNTAARFDGAFREAAAIAIATARFMETFYGELDKGRTVPAALRQTKLRFLGSERKTDRDLYRWAPFVVVGDPSVRPMEKPNRGVAAATTREEDPGL